MAFERYQINEANLTSRRSRDVFTVKCYYHAFHGDLIPTLILEALPGDNWRIKCNDLTRMQTPITSVMGNIRKHHACFMVPKRIIWNHTKQFYGEATTFGIAQKVDMPRFATADLDADNGVSIGVRCAYPNLDLMDLSANTKSGYYFNNVLGQNPLRSFGCYLNLVAQNSIFFTTFSASTDLQPVNVLPLWAIMKVYNEHFRDQNFCSPYQWDMNLNGDQPLGPNPVIATRNGDSVSFCSSVPKVRKDNDMFTTFLPWAQKGDPVSVPVLGDAPVVGNGKGIGLEGFNLVDNKVVDGVLYQPVNSASLGDILLGSKHGLNKASGANYDDEILTGDALTGVIGLSQNVANSNLIAKVGNATAITISQLLYALAYQDFLQRLCKFGSRYGDYIKAIFGVTTDDSTQDIPEFLGYYSQRLNIDTVVQTTGHDFGDNTKLGEVGGYSNTFNTGTLADYACKEPGYICLFTYFKHERVYSAGIDEMFLKKELLDEYQTPFANISDTPYSQALIFFDGTKTGTNVKLGFNEPWLSYRTRSDRVIGLLNPNIPNSSEFWTLAEKYYNAPILGADFIEEDRDAIARALTSGVNGPDYICSTNYEIDLIRVMPTHSSGRIGTF